MILFNPLYYPRMNTQLKARTTILTMEHPLEPVFRKGLFAAFFVLVLLYLYLVFASVLNVIASKEASSNAARLEGVVGTREQEYLAMSQFVTPETGAEIGLAPVETPTYVVRPSTVGMADTNSSY